MTVSVIPFKNRGLVITLQALLHVIVTLDPLEELLLNGFFFNPKASHTSENQVESEETN